MTRSLAQIIADLEALKVEIIANAAARDRIDGAGDQEMVEAECDLISAIQNLDAARSARIAADEEADQSAADLGYYHEMNLRCRLEAGA